VVSYPAQPTPQTEQIWQTKAQAEQQNPDHHHQRHQRPEEVLHISMMLEGVEAADYSKELLQLKLYNKEGSA